MSNRLYSTEKRSKRMGYREREKLETPLSYSRFLLKITITASSIADPIRTQQISPTIYERFTVALDKK